jgi:hypothetical protein
MSALFPPGKIVATLGRWLPWKERSSRPPVFWPVMQSGDWGELDQSDVAENEHSMAHGFRLLSSYRTDAGEKLWIITESDRSATTLLLPDEY